MCMCMYVCVCVKTIIIKKPLVYMFEYYEYFEYLNTVFIFNKR